MELSTLAEPSKKTWREKRTVNLLLISASQLETWRLCRRKWWLERIRQLDVVSTKDQIFGTVLHAVCERFLRADELGRDPATGLAVDLYPPGWEIAPSRFGEPSEGSATLQEQDLIRRLIAAAIENGVLERQPGRLIESDFRRSIIKPADGVHVQILGFIDLCTRDTVTDHKTTKNIKYAKSANKLKENVQMLTYAMELIQRAKDKGEPPPAMFTLRHNVFVKNVDDPRVRKTETIVMREDVEREWDRICEDAKDMVELRAIAQEWSDIREPVNPAAACNAYGGCPYLSICCGHETPENYEKRLDFITKMANNVSTSAATVVATTGAQAPEQKENTAMSFEAMLAARRAKNASATAAPAPQLSPPAPSAPAVAPAAPAPVQQPAPAAVAAPVAAPAAVATPAAVPPAVTAQAGHKLAVAPWAAPDCPACRGTGFNSKGNACRICDSKAAAAGRAASSAYVLETLGNGMVAFMSRENPDIAGECSITGQVAAPVVVQEKVQLPPVAAPVAAPAPAAAPVAAAVAAPVLPPPVVVEAAAPVAAPAVEEAADDKKKNATGAGRPKKGFILLIGAVVSKGIDRQGSGRYVYRLEELHRDLGIELAKASKVESYYDIDAFARRDALTKFVPSIVEQFGCDMIVCPQSMTPDLRAFFEALRPYAGCEIVAASVQ